MIHTVSLADFCHWTHADDQGPKDPGLPSQWPFREELVKEFAFKRAQILAAEKLKKDQKKARRAVRGALAHTCSSSDLVYPT
jgi:hypothetical protein